MEEQAPEFDQNPEEQEEPFDRMEYMTRTARECGENMQRIFKDYSQYLMEAPYRRDENINKFGKSIFKIAWQGVQKASRDLSVQINNLVDSSPTLSEIDPKAIDADLLYMLRSIGFILEKRFHLENAILHPENAQTGELDAHQQRFIRNNLETLYNSKCLLLFGEEQPFPELIDKLFPAPSPHELPEEHHPITPAA